LRSASIEEPTVTATPSSQARHPEDFLSPLSAVVVPFPQTRRVHAVARIAKRIARARTREKGDAVLAAAIRKQRGAMTRKGVASDKVKTRMRTARMRCEGAGVVDYLLAEL
jgi:hypothetical protein